MGIKVFSRKTATTAAFVVGSLVLGVAFASWTANGAGAGTARSISATASAVTGRNGAPDLYPGFADGDLYFTVTNPNPYPVRFSSANFATVVSSDPANCPAANVTPDASISGLAIDVPANSTGTDAVIQDVVNMDVNAPDGCQGKSFTIDVTLTGAQQ